MSQVFPDGEPIQQVFCLFYWDGSHTDLVSVHRSLEAAQTSFISGLGTSKRAAKERAALSWRLDPHDLEHATWNLVRPRMLDEFSGTFIERRRVEP